VRGAGPERADKQLARAAMRLANSHQSDAVDTVGGILAEPCRAALGEGAVRKRSPRKKLRPS